MLFEKADRCGGRVATTAIGEYVFDSGATTIAPDNKALARVMLDELPTDDLVRIEAPIFVHESLRVASGDPRKNAIPRYTYRSGNAKLPELLANGLDVRLNAEVNSFSRQDGGKIQVLSEPFDAIVVAIPAPDALQLLQAAGEWRPLGSIYFRPCLSVLLGYELELPSVRYHAIVDPEQRHPLTWLSIESKKSPGRAPEGCTAMVAQLSPMFSGSHFADPDSRVVELALDYIERLYGSDWCKPAVSAVVRWKYSQPEAIASFDVVNRAGSNIVVAGDGLIGSRTEHAYDSGVRAAGLLLSAPPSP